MKSKSSVSTEDKISALIHKCAQQRADEVAELLRDSCESPIEKLLLASLLHDGWAIPDQQEWTSGRDWIRKESGAICHRMFGLAGFGGFYIAPQLSVTVGEANYRLDFALFGVCTKYVIELDGHDFHERTKEQARRDKARDRALTLAGWKVLRFTGSEVYADANQIATDILNLCTDDIELLEQRSAARARMK